MEWISVKDRLPQARKGETSGFTVLILSDGKAEDTYPRHYTGYYAGGWYFWGWAHHEDEPKVTHWMPLPEDPK